MVMEIKEPHAKTIWNWKKYIIQNHKNLNISRMVLIEESAGLMCLNHFFSYWLLFNCWLWYSVSDGLSSKQTQGAPRSYWVLLWVGFSNKVFDDEILTQLVRKLEKFSLKFVSYHKIHFTCKFLVCA